MIRRPKPQMNNIDFKSTFNKEYLITPKVEDDNYTIEIVLDNSRYYLDDFFREMGEILQANKSLLIESSKTILAFSQSMDMVTGVYTINIKTKNNE
jgi:hypothetical protein